MPGIQSRLEDHKFTVRTTAWSAEVRKRLTVKLNGEQKKALRMALDEGQNVFFTGAAGTGKSMLLGAIIMGLGMKYKKTPTAISVMASTGMAACNINGLTIHAWGGITPGQTDLEKQLKSVRSCKPAADRWRKTKVLIIDEISMVDRDLFGMLASIGGAMRGGDLPFGGIQLVVTGDFFQLPPVCERGEQPKFAFESKAWSETMKHTVMLNEVFRQTDAEFVTMLHQLRMGQVSPKAHKTFSDLSRELPPKDGIIPAELFPTRAQVNSANEDRLKALGTEMRAYEARDRGNGKKERVAEMLKNVVAQESLELKAGAQVMLIKNKDQSLVNGSIGRVLGFYKRTGVMGEEGTISKNGKGAIRQVIMEDETEPVEVVRKGHEAETEAYPLVEFLTAGGKEYVLVGRDEFRVEDKEGKVARRYQIPLILAWAITIHKSQGQTLQYVKVDVGGVFEKGQTYVALSRAASLDGLQVLNFKRDKVKAHATVVDWYRTRIMEAEQQAEGA